MSVPSGFKCNLANVNVSNIKIGSLPRGARNKITDVSGVLVGHSTCDDPERGVHTGITVIIPKAESAEVFRQKFPAGAAVYNGFGKSTGLIQIAEKGTLETPIVLTGVSSVGAMYDAQFRRSMTECPEICNTTGSVNPIVCECNDSFLNDARATCLGSIDLDAAYKSADLDFAQGAVGAGRGMSCFGLKGGIGSASRLVTIKLNGHDKNSKLYTVGVLVNANFGVLKNFILAGRSIGLDLERVKASLTQSNVAATASAEREHGSIILVLATDAPLDSRQLTRLARRCFVGVARTGSYVGDGSGDIAIAFSTANRVPHEIPNDGLIHMSCLHDALIDPLLQAAAEASEESILTNRVKKSPTARASCTGRHFGSCLIRQFSL